jgi:hypothetical protein
MKKLITALVILVLVVCVIRYWVPITLALGTFVAVKLIVRHTRRTRTQTHTQTPPPVIPHHSAPKRRSVSPTCLSDEHLFCEDKTCQCECGHDTSKIVANNEAKYLDKCPF